MYELLLTLAHEGRLRKATVLAFRDSEGIEPGEADALLALFPGDPVPASPEPPVAAPEPEVAPKPTLESVEAQIDDLLDQLRQLREEAPDA